MDLDATISLQKHTIDGLRADLARQRDLIRELEANASLHWITEEELKQVRADLARVTAERDNMLRRVGVEFAEGVALRARVSELVEQLKAYGKYAHDTTLEDQNDELVAALTDIHSAAMVDGFTEEAPDMVCKIHELATKALARAESATCQKATNPSQISSESATPGLRTDNPMAEPVMGGLPRYDGEKLGTPAKQHSAP